VPYINTGAPGFNARVDTAETGYYELNRHLVTYGPRGGVRSACGRRLRDPYVESWDVGRRVEVPVMNRRHPINTVLRALRCDDCRGLLSSCFG
jgi:hypothetical protein